MGGSLVHRAGRPPARTAAAPGPAGPDASTVRGREGGQAIGGQSEPREQTRGGLSEPRARAARHVVHRAGRAARSGGGLPLSPPWRGRHDVPVPAVRHRPWCAAVSKTKDKTQ